MKMKKTIQKRTVKMCSIFLAIALLLPSLCLAADLFITSDYNAGYSEISDIEVLEQNSFHRDEYIIGDEPAENMIALLDSNNQLISEEVQGETVTLLPFDPAIPPSIPSDLGNQYSWVCHCDRLPALSVVQPRHSLLHQASPILLGPL